MNKYQKIVVLTGAGISAESGIRTFRAADGLWEEHRVEDVATPEGFAANPSLVYQFYHRRRMQLLQTDIQPNAAHKALAMFEREFTGRFMLVTQNVDDLHEKAGSQQVYHMHGELMKARCQYCEDVTVLPASEKVVLNESLTCQACGRQGSMRPHIVWFGEMPFYMEPIYQALAECDLFISIGTSGHVYPAAGFYSHASSYGAECVELNLEPSKNAGGFDQGIYGMASEIVPSFMQSLRG